MKPKYASKRDMFENIKQVEIGRSTYSDEWVCQAWILVEEKVVRVPAADYYTDDLKDAEVAKRVMLEKGK